MFICAAGDIHGAMDRLYRDVFAFEASLGIRFEHVLQVGDFGIWPDSSRIDKATRHHDGAGDFPAWLRENRAAPRPTVFIKGNHEDFVWLDTQHDAEVLPGLTYLRNGCTVDIQDQDGGGIRVGGVGGCYGPSDYPRRSDRLQGYAKRHYTSDEIERLADVGGVDIVLTHDAPAGVRFEVECSLHWAQQSRNAGKFGSYRYRAGQAGLVTTWRIHASREDGMIIIPILGIIMPKMGAKKRQPSARAPVDSGVADALFTKVQQRVLAVLFGNHARSFYANELIALARSGSGAVQRELAQLEAAELVTVRRVGYQKHYQANASAPIFEELRGLASR